MSPEKLPRDLIPRFSTAQSLVFWWWEDAGEEYPNRAVRFYCQPQSIFPTRSLAVPHNARGGVFGRRQFSRIALWHRAKAIEVLQAYTCAGPCEFESMFPAEDRPRGGGRRY